MKRTTRFVPIIRCLACGSRLRWVRCADCAEKGIVCRATCCVACGEPGPNTDQPEPEPKHRRRTRS